MDPDAGLFSSSARPTPDRDPRRSRRLVQSGPDERVATPRGKTGLVVGLVTGVLVLALCGGGGAVVMLTAAPLPSPSLTAGPTANADADTPALVAFKDQRLRLFARAGATKATDCEPLATSENRQEFGLTEAVRCTYSNGMEIDYLRFESIQDRNFYRRSAAVGFNGDTLEVELNAPWADDAGNRQGTVIAGLLGSAGLPYLYWDLADFAVAAQLVATHGTRPAAEAFWREIR